MGTSLNLALIGFGKMGREIAGLAPDRGHKIASTFDIESQATVATVTAATDVLIDFSVPGAVLENIRMAAAARVPLVVGTTGWHDKLDAVRQIVESSGIGMIYASNFSLGMNVFSQIVSHAAALFDKFEDYDPFVHEIHHRGKVDSPSGTALTLAEILLARIARKSEILTETSKGDISPDQLHVTSTRAGSVPGTHCVSFDSGADTIELKHTARNRRGFAIGALYAAEWVVDRQGLFTMEDFLADFTG